MLCSTPYCLVLKLMNSGKINNIEKPYIYDKKVYKCCGAVHSAYRYTIKDFFLFHNSETSRSVVDIVYI